MEGLYGNFQPAILTPPANSLNCQSLQAVHGTEGERAETGDGGRGEHATDEEEDI